MSAGNKQIYIDKYALAHFARGWGNAMNVIRCYSLQPGTDEIRPQRLQYVGDIGFYPRGQVPGSDWIGSDSTIVRTFRLNYEIDRYPDIIETLRYEKPVFLYLSWNVEGSFTLAYISTSVEPIGEQEGPGVST